MRIIMIDDNGRQSDITNEVQNILRGTRQNGNVASDREQMPRAGFTPQQGYPAYGPQRPQQTPFPQGRFVPQNMREERPQGGFVPQQEFIPQGEMIPVPVDEFGNPMENIPSDEEFGGFIPAPAPAPMEFNGHAQRPVMQRPVMGRPMMGMPQQHERQSFDEQAHRFAQRMTNGNGQQFVPAQGGMRRVTSPNYRRNY